MSKGIGKVEQRVISLCREMLTTVNNDLPEWAIDTRLLRKTYQRRFTDSRFSEGSWQASFCRAVHSLLRKSILKRVFVVFGNERQTFITLIPPVPPVHYERARWLVALEDHQ